MEFSPTGLKISGLYRYSLFIVRSLVLIAERPEKQMDIKNVMVAEN